MSTLSFDALLTPEAVESKLRGSRPYLQGYKWADSVIEHGLRIDASKVQFADFAALAQVLILVEGALRRRCAVEVALPFPHLRAGEKVYLASISDQPDWLGRERGRIDANVQRRGGALAFMRNSGFISALSCSHVPDHEELLKLDFQRDSRDAPSPLMTEPGSTSRTSAGDETIASLRMPKNIIPFQWLDANAREQRDVWDREAMRLLTIRGIALSTSDAEAVARVVYRELINNVGDHAADSGTSVPPAALVGGVVIRRPRRADALGDRGVSKQHAVWLHSTGAPVLRLIVGDSGQGLCRTLPDNPADEDPSRTHHPDAWSSNERILIQAMAPWTTRRSADVQREGVRGLASVRRVVGESAGVLLFRSANAVAGYAYPRQGRQTVGTARLPWVPGTLVDIVLAPSAVPRTLRAASAVDDAPTVLAVSHVDTSSAQPADLGGVSRTVRDVGDGASTNISVLVLDLPDEVEARYRFGCHVLEAADGIADHAGLVLLAPSQSVAWLSPRLREVDDLREERQHHASVPVMVLDEQGEIGWLGISSPVRRLLSAVISSPDGIETSSVPGIVGRAEGVAQALLASLRRWLVTDDQRIRLRVSPAALVNSILSHFREQVGDGSFAARGPGVRGRLMLTPTLAAVERWIDSARVIDRLGGPRLAGYLLGLKVAQALGDVAEHDLAVAFIGRVPEPVRRAFMAAVGARGRQFELSGEVGLMDDPGAPFVRAETSLVCLTDLMVTATHVRHALHDLIRAGAQPLAVACFVDGRLANAQLFALGRELPVCAAVELPLAVNRGDQEVEAVEPVSIPPGFLPPPDPPAPPISSADLLTWCAEIEGSLLTGHVARLARRHFSSLLDVGPLLKSPELRARLELEIQREVEHWLDRHDEVLENLVVLRPGRASERSSLFADLVAKTVVGIDRAPPLRDVLAVERVVRAGRNVLAMPSERLFPATGALVADWGAVTLHTAQELIHISADVGATAILALIFSSQLAVEDELAASHVRAVSGREPDYERKPGQLAISSTPSAVRRVPAEIRFLCSLPVGYAPSAECATCALAREYTQLATHAPSALLSQHARETASTLEPVDLQVSRADGPRDVFGGRLSPAQAAAVVRVRHRLADAQLGTDARLDVVDGLRTVSSEALDDIVRALALEPRWLKLPPLRFQSARQILGDALISRMRSRSFADAPETMRRQYAVILRASSKRHFLSNFDVLLADAVERGDARVSNDLLIGAHTLTTRPYHQHQQAHKQQIDALMAGAERLRRSDLALSEHGLEVRAALRNMVAQVDLAAGRARDAQLSAREAWVRLREDFWQKITAHEHDLPIRSIEAAIRVRSVRTAGNWDLEADDFGRVQRFLATDVLPRLEPVSEILVGWFTEHDEEQLPELRLLLGTDGLAELGRLGDLLSDFARDPASAPVQRDQVSAALARWWNFFFGRKHPAWRPRGLLGAVGGCPCDVDRAFLDGLDSALPLAQRTIKSMEVIRRGSDGQFLGFSHSTLVQAIGQHLLVNATETKHAAEHYGGGVAIEVRLSGEGKQIEITMLNDGTAPSRFPGQGLSTLRRRLAAYGGALEPVTDLGPRWTYGIRLTVLRPWEQQ